jgi:signal transduction histidine kinase
MEMKCGKFIHRKVYLIVVFLLGIIIPSLILTIFGFRATHYRKYWMTDMVQKNAHKSAIILVQNVERQIIDLEKELLMELAMEREKRQSSIITESQLQTIREKYPFIQDIYFFDAEYMLKYSIPSNAQLQNRKMREWLLSRVQVDIKKWKPSDMELRHLSDIFNGIPIQIGYASLPYGLKGESLGYLVFSLNINYIRFQLLDKFLLNMNRQEQHQHITVESWDEPGVTSDTVKENHLIIEVPFTRVLTFWKIKATLDTGALQKNARQDLIVYSGLIILVLIGIGILLTFQYVRQEWRLSQIKSEMVSHVSHELKTPLSLIRIYAETLMLGRVTQEQKVHEYYNIIVKECERLTFLINNILDFSIIEKGVKEYHFSEGDLSHLLHQIFESYSGYIQQNGFNLRLRIEGQKHLFNFDKMAMNQAVLNLLDNAMKFSNSKKEIDLALEKQDGKIVIRVSDQGKGIDSREINRIFEPFYRGHGITRGAGIGLALVKHIVEAHGGEVTVESEIGKGSTFAILLPVQEAS